jgi:lipooligosaccharide transport system ATP-binding protein
VEPLIHARGLTKRFGEFTAVAGVDFDVQPGEAFGFLGPNGAGKSSTMRMIGCVSPPSGGTLRILGMDPVKQGSQIRARLGVVPQEDTLDMELTVSENLYVYGRYFGLSRKVVRKRSAELLDFVQLSERPNSKVQQLSGGMKRRLTIARALVNEPDVLLLDEPTTGLDPQARHLVWDRLFRLKQRVIMHNGTIAEEGSPLELIRRLSTREVVELRFQGEPPPVAAGTFNGRVARVEVLPERVLLYTDDGDALVPVAHERLQPQSVLVRRSTLEDVFLRLTGRTLID